MTDYIIFNFGRVIHGVIYNFSFVVQQEREIILEMKMNDLVKLYPNDCKKIVFSVSDDLDWSIRDGKSRMMIYITGGISSFPLETFKQMTVGSVIATCPPTFNIVNMNGPSRENSHTWKRFVGLMD